MIDIISRSPQRLLKIEPKRDYPVPWCLKRFQWTIKMIIVLVVECPPIKCCMSTLRDSMSSDICKIMKIAPGAQIFITTHASKSNAFHVIHQKMPSGYRSISAGAIGWCPVLPTNTCPQRHSCPQKLRKGWTPKRDYPISWYLKMLNSTDDVVRCWVFTNRVTRLLTHSVMKMAPGAQIPMESHHDTHTKIERISPSTCWIWHSPPNDTSWWMKMWRAHISKDVLRICKHICRHNPVISMLIMPHFNWWFTKLTSPVSWSYHFSVAWWLLPSAVRWPLTFDLCLGFVFMTMLQCTWLSDALTRSQCEMAQRSMLHACIWILTQHGHSRDMILRISYSSTVDDSALHLPTNKFHHDTAMHACVWTVLSAIMRKYQRIFKKCESHSTIDVLQHKN